MKNKTIDFVEILEAAKTLKDYCNGMENCKYCGFKLSCGGCMLINFVPKKWDLMVELYITAIFTLK